MGDIGPYGFTYSWKKDLLKVNLAQVTWPDLDDLNLYLLWHALRRALRPLLVGYLRVNQRDSKIAYQPVKVGDQLPGILAAAGVWLIPEIPVNCQVHRARFRQTLMCDNSYLIPIRIYDCIDDQ
jgi:hypothetical protein